MLAESLNNRGQVVGRSFTIVEGEISSMHAFVWEDGTLTDLGALPGDARRFGWDINDRGQIVGQSQTD